MGYKPRKCKICNKEFIPNSPKQIYCKNLHYRTCPICGKSYAESNLDKFKFPPTTCSMECRVAKRTATSLDRYGITAPGNNPEARAKAVETMNQKYGVDYAQESKEIKQKSIDTWTQKYGVDNPQKDKKIQEKTKQTNIDKYGSTTYLTSEEGKERIADIMTEKYGTVVPLRNAEIMKRMLDTNEQRYGVPYPAMSDEVKERTKQTSLQKYGTEYPQSSDIVKQHIKETFIRNYGVDNCFKSQEIIQKIKDSFFAHYGTHSVMETKEIADRIVETNKKRYGVPYGVMLPYARKSSGAISNHNKRILTRLEHAGIRGQLEYVIDKYSYDVYIPGADIVIEIDPSYTHSVLGNHWNPKGIKKDYHLKKTIAAEDHGYRCIHLWDWDNTAKFIGQLISKHTISTSDPPEIIPKSVAEEFIQKYGLYDVTGNIPNTVFLGIQYRTKLMSLMGFRQIDPIFNMWELVCIESRFGYTVYNGNQQILDEFIRQYNPGKIISYADFSKTNGEILEALGFEYTRFIFPNKIWSKGHHAIIDDPMIMPEAMIAEHWLPVYNCGYKVYEKQICTLPWLQDA